MQKLKIPFLIISSFFLLISCVSTNPVNGLIRLEPENTTYKSNYFSDPKADYVYKTNISVYGNELSGICIIKKIKDNFHRVVFTTEFGNKLMDFEISDSDFKVNSIVDELNKKILIKTLTKDFQLLLKENFEISGKYDKSENIIISSEAGKDINYLLISKQNNNLREIISSSIRKEKINIAFTSENNIFANKIVIQHKNLKLRIEFNHFKNDN